MQTLTDRRNSIATTSWSLSPWLAMLCLVVSLLAAAAVLSTFGFQASGMLGVWAAFYATAACAAGAAPALLIVAITRNTEASLPGLLISIFFRSGIPLVLAFAVRSRFPELAAGGAFGMTIACYLWTLAIETLLSVGMISSVTSAANVADGGAS